MSSEPRVVELSSSDEAEYERSSFKRCRYDDYDDDDDDDVVIIEKSQCTFTRSRERKERSFVDSDDCFILENVPKVELLESVENDVEELVVIGEIGQVACRDFPHARHLCARFSFKETPHKDYCEQCHCYVCDKLAPCEFWESHCHASDKEGHWKTMRQSKKSPQIPPSATPPLPTMLTTPARPGSVCPAARTNLPRSSSSVTMSDIARGLARLQPTPRRLTGPRTPKVHKNRTSLNAQPRYATAGTPPAATPSPPVAGSGAPAPAVHGLARSSPARPPLTPAPGGLTRESPTPVTTPLSRTFSAPPGPAAGVRPPVTLPLRLPAGLTKPPAPRPPQTPPLGHLRRRPPLTTVGPPLTTVGPPPPATPVAGSARAPVPPVHGQALSKPARPPLTPGTTRQSSAPVRTPLSTDPPGSAAQHRESLLALLGLPRSPAPPPQTPPLGHVRRPSANSVEGTHETGPQNAKKHRKLSARRAMPSGTVSKQPNNQQTGS